MTAQFPVHPDDVEQLLRIRRYLIGYRHTNGWSQSQLSQMMNGTDGAVHDLETSQTWQWRWSRLQGWPEPFGLRLGARLVLSDRRQDKKIHQDPEVEPLYHLSCRSESYGKIWQRAYLTAVMRAARRVKGISTAQMGRMLGCTYGAINTWENASNKILLPKALQYARALDGYIKLSLDG